MTTPAWVSLCGVLFVAPSLTAEPASIQGSVDTVCIRLDAGEAMVEQRLPGPGEAFAIRIPGQRLEFSRVTGSAGSELGPRLDADTVLAGAYRVFVSEVGVTVRYRVSGEISRIPLFVPAGKTEITVAAEARANRVLLVEGDPGRLDEVDLAISLPRFRRVADDVLIGELSSLPSFVRLVRRGALSFARLLDLAVVVLICIGAVWAWRRGRHPVAAPPRGRVREAG